MEYKREYVLPDHSGEGVEQPKRPLANRKFVAMETGPILFVEEWFVYAWYGGEKTECSYKLFLPQNWGELEAWRKDLTGWLEKYREPRKGE